MRTLYLVSVALHILAATTWIGGMAFIVFVVVPWLRSQDRAKAASFLADTGLRFRLVGWICFAILVVTGTFNLHMRGVHLADLVSASFWTSPFGSAVACKLAAFAAVLLVSGIHDFSVGPRAVAATPGSPEADRLRRRASLLGRLNAVLAILLVVFAVIIVRGWP